jgi:uncharacterized membrane protein
VFTLYNFLKFLHVLGVVVWLGGLLTMLMLSTRFARSRDPAVMRALSEQGRFLGAAFFGPAAGITLITGIALVMVGHLSFGLLWISWGMTGVILSLIVGGAMVGRMAAQLTKRIEAGQANAADIAATQRKIVSLNLVNLVILVSVLFAMIFKFG